MRLIRTDEGRPMLIWCWRGADCFVTTGSLDLGYYEDWRAFWVHLGPLVFAFGLRPPPHA